MGRQGVGDAAWGGGWPAGSGVGRHGCAVALAAKGMTDYGAAGAAAWLHGEAAASFGPGLIAEDICATLPVALASLKGADNR